MGSEFDDELLEEFGFKANEGLLVRGRGNVINLTGKVFGLYECIGRHPENKKSGEAMWILKCSNCKKQRIACGNDLRHGRIRCIECQGCKNGRGSRFYPKDYKIEYEKLKTQISSAIETDDIKEIFAVCVRLKRVCEKLLSTTKST